MSDFNFIPAVQAQVLVEPRVNRATFGDGYEQRAGDGINIAPEKWDLTFNKRRQIDAIETQLAGYGAISSFTWTSPRGVEIRVVCREWSRLFIDRSNSILRATFEQVFDL